MAPEGNLRELTGALKAEREGRAGGGDSALISWYAARDPWREKLERLMDAVCRTRQEDGIGKTVARALYGTPAGRQRHAPWNSSRPAPMPISCSTACAWKNGRPVN